MYQPQLIEQPPPPPVELTTQSVVPCRPSSGVQIDLPVHFVCPAAPVTAAGAICSTTAPTYESSRSATNAGGTKPFLSTMEPREIIAQILESTTAMMLQDDAHSFFTGTTVSRSHEGDNYSTPTRTMNLPFCMITLIYIHG